MCLQNRLLHLLQRQISTTKGNLRTFDWPKFQQVNMFYSYPSALPASCACGTIQHPWWSYPWWISSLWHHSKFGCFCKKSIAHLSGRSFCLFCLDKANLSVVFWLWFRLKNHFWKLQQAAPTRLLEPGPAYIESCLNKLASTNMSSALGMTE